MYYPGCSGFKRQGGAAPANPVLTFRIANDASGAAARAANAYFAAGNVPAVISSSIAGSSAVALSAGVIAAISAAAIAVAGLAVAGGVVAVRKLRSPKSGDETKPTELYDTPDEAAQRSDWPSATLDEAITKTIGVTNPTAEAPEQQAPSMTAGPSVAAVERPKGIRNTFYRWSPPGGQ